MIASGGSTARFGGAALSAAVLAIVLGGAGLLIWLDRVNTLRDGHQIAMRLVHVLGEQTARTIHAIDLILTGLGDELYAATNLAEHDPAFEDRMRAHLRASPFIRALFVIAPDGFITQDTDHPSTPRVSLADRGYFIAHVERDDLGLHIGPPLRSRSVNVWFVSVSRRVPSADGSFAGIVVAAVEPRYFEQFYEGLGLGAAGSIALFQRSGVLIARHPHIESAIGKSYGGYEPFRSQLETMSTGSLETQGAIGGSVQILAYSTVEGTPLVVSVGLSKRTLLANWQRRATVASGSALGIAGLGTVVLLLLLHLRRQRDVVRQQVAQAQRLDAVGRVAAGIVHDFRNLLMAMASGVRLLRRGAADEALTPVLDEMDAAVQRGTTLAAKLLTISRQQDLALETVDVNQLMSGLEPLLRNAAGSSIQLQMALASEVWPCRLDLEEFDRAVLNLITNARDAMPNGGEVRLSTANVAGRAGIDRTTGPIGDYVRVTVADSGQGMTPEVAQRALEPFYTTKGDAGTGLGLSQVYSFVRQVGGDLRLESKPGAGTTVELFFPQCASTQRTTAPAQAEVADVPSRQLSDHVRGD